MSRIKSKGAALRHFDKLSSSRLSVKEQSAGSKAQSATVLYEVVEIESDIDK